MQVLLLISETKISLEELWPANPADGASENLKNSIFYFSVFKRKYLGPLTSFKVVLSELMVSIACGQVLKS